MPQASSAAGINKYFMMYNKHERAWRLHVWEKSWEFSAKIFGFYGVEGVVPEDFDYKKELAEYRNGSYGHDTGTSLFK